VCGQTGFLQPVWAKLKNAVLDELGCSTSVGELLEVETTLEPIVPDLPDKPHKRLPTWAAVRELGVFLIFTAFFLVYGLTPLLGGDGLGLVGADRA
jgi:hypothetical protein